MTIGPTRYLESVLRRVSEQPWPITEPQFLDMTRRCCRQFRELIGERAGHQFIIPGTGTMGMEMALANFAPPGSTVLVMCTGSWGERWSAIGERLGCNVHRFAPPPGFPVDLHDLECALRQHRPSAVFLTHVDSSTGVCVDVPAVSRLISRSNALFIVDGICAAGAEIVEQADWGIDVYLASTPKAIGAPAGLVLLSLSERATTELWGRTWNPPTYSLDIRPWLSVFDGARDGRFEYFQSPAGNLMAGLDETLKLILSEGRSGRYRRHLDIATSLHQGLAAIGVEILATEEARSVAVTVCRYPVGHGPEMLTALRAMGLLLPTGTHPALGPETFRIGHLGNVRPSDIEFTVDCLSLVMGQRSLSLVSS